MLQNCEVLEEKLRQCSGVLIKKSNENKWILCGNLPQIELAHNCIRDMLLETKEQRMSQTSVAYAVKVLEEKRKEILREKRSTGNSDLASDPTVERKGKSTMAASGIFLPHMTSKVDGCTEYYLRKNFRILLQKGDILKIEVDTVCCGQDPFFQSKGHIAKSIIRQCKDVEIQLRKAVEKRGNKGFHTGEVIMTKCSANLSKYIIFVVTESPASSKETTQEILFGIKMCFSNIFEFADQNKIRRLAVPLLGTGNGLQNFFKIECDQHHFLLLSL